MDLKGKAKAFLRTYEFLSAILSYTNAEWEKLSIFLTFLVSKLPAPKEEDLSKGIQSAHQFFQLIFLIPLRRLFGHGFGHGLGSISIVFYHTQ